MMFLQCSATALPNSVIFISFFKQYTAEIHRDKYNLIKAISVMADVANAINEFKRRKDLGKFAQCNFFFHLFEFLVVKVFILVQ